MRLRIMSDLHLEFHKDGGECFVNSLETEGTDILILAGDICMHQQLDVVLTSFCKKFPKVVYTLGNHEYYRSSRYKVCKTMKNVCEKNDNLIWLEASSKIIDGVKFVGGTLWFKEAPMAPKWSLSDFSEIENFESWVYDLNRETTRKIEDEIDGNCVVVTHHLPSFKSVHEAYKRSQLNPFFVCDLEPMIKHFKPKLWIHGHTHVSMWYNIGPTQVICNPFGYMRREENPNFNENLTVEI